MESGKEEKMTLKLDTPGRIINMLARNYDSKGRVVL